MKRTKKNQRQCQKRNQKENWLYRKMLNWQILEELQNKASEDPNELIDTKIAEVLAIVTALEENNKELTDLEVDSLLRQAQKEILTAKTYKF